MCRVIILHFAYVQHLFSVPCLLLVEDAVCILMMLSVCLSVCLSRHQHFSLFTRLGEKHSLMAGFCYKSC